MRRLVLLRWLAFGAGLAISLVMVLRAQVHGDAFYLLVRGVLLIDHAWLVPFGNPMSGGGFAPGPLTSLLTGLPLLVVRDYRVIGLSILATHVVAYVLLDRHASRLLGPRGRLLLALAYWLNPWRLYFSAHVWNPNWMFVLGAVHFATAAAQRERPSFAASLVHGLAIGAAVQVHGSFLVLAVLSVALWWRGLIRVHWGGLGLATFLSVAALVPWMLEVDEHPELLPAQQGTPFRGLLHVYPLLKGAALWFRYESFALGRQLVRFDFTPDVGAAADSLLAPAAIGLLGLGAAATLGVAVLANVALWRGREPRSGGEKWVSGYCRCAFVAALLCFAASPTTAMMWQGFVVLHAAALVLVLWTLRLWDAPSPVNRRVRIGAALHAALALAAGIALAFGAPMYRQGGRRAVIVEVSSGAEALASVGVPPDLVTVSPTGASSRLLAGRPAWDARDPPPEPGEKW